MKRLAEIKTPGVVDAVIQALHDAKTVRERLTGLQALLRVSSPGNSFSFAAAIPHLQDPDKLVRDAAVEVMKCTGPKSDAALSEVAETEQMLYHELENSFSGARVGALQVLRHLTKVKRLNGLTAIVHCIEDSDVHLRLAAAEALQDLAVDQPQDVIAEVLPRLDHPEWFVRKAVVEVLSASGVLKAALPPLSGRLAHKDVVVRRNATEALVALAEKDSGETLQMALLLLTHPLSDTRLCGVEVLHRTASPGDMTALHALARLLGDCKAVRAAALDAIASLANRNHGDLAKPISRSLKDTDAGVRAAASKVLGVVACDSESIVDLRPLLEDSDVKVRLATIGALVQIGQRIGSVEMAAAAVKPCLKDLDERVREAAAEVIFCCSTEPAIPFTWLELESTRS
jgi:HEAT repeat protein